MAISSSLDAAALALHRKLELQRLRSLLQRL
jgi:hypothetical protein